MRLQQAIKLGTLILLGVQMPFIQANESQQEPIGNPNPSYDYEFEYETSYNQVVLTMKDNLIAQLKNTMISAIMDQEFIDQLLENYWRINP